MNEDVKENQLKIVLKGSDGLKKCGSNYVKYKLRYGEEQKETGHIYITEDSKTFMHTFNDWPELKKNFHQAEVEFALKKKKLLVYKTTVDTQKVKLTNLHNKCVFSKAMKIDGNDFTADFMLHKALKGGEFDR
jgi:glutaredoxin-related protein